MSTRALLACGGVLAAVLGIVSSLGFLSYLGVEYVNFVGIMPFLVMGASFVMSSCLSWSWVGLLSCRHAVPGHGWVFCHVVMPFLVMGGSSCLSGHGWVVCRVTMPFLVTGDGSFCHVTGPVLNMGGSFLSCHHAFPGHGWVYCCIV